MGLCQCILISCFKLHSIALKLDHRRHWIYLYEKNARQQALPCLVLKIQTKICRRTKYALTTTSLTRTLKRGFLNQLCGKIMRLDFETNLVNILVYSFTFFLDTNYFYQHQLLRLLENQNVFHLLIFSIFFSFFFKTLLGSQGVPRKRQFTDHRTANTLQIFVSKNVIYSGLFSF